MRWLGQNQNGLLKCQNSREEPEQTLYLKDDFGNSFWCLCVVIQMINIFLWKRNSEIERNDYIEQEEKHSDREPWWLATSYHVAMI